MTRLRVLWCALALGGCPGGGDGGAGSGAGWECEPDFSGTWELQYEVQSGDCGPITTEIVNFSSTSTSGLVDQACETDEPTGDACEGQTKMSTCDAVLPDGNAARIVRTAFLKQTGPDEITGRFMARITTQGQVCSGTYDILGTRL